MVSKKGLCKVLKKTFSAGYEIIPSANGKVLTLNGSRWAVQVPTTELPVDVALQIVGDAGYLPVEAMRVQKGDSNQMIIAEAVTQRTEFFKPSNSEVLTMMKIPIIFKDRWQLYQTENGEVYAFDVEYLEMIDFDDCQPEVVMRATGNTGIWFFDGQAVYIAPGHFSAEDRERLAYIAAMDWERQQANNDPVENLNLFDRQDAAEAETEDAEADSQAKAESDRGDTEE